MCGQDKHCKLRYGDLEVKIDETGVECILNGVLKGGPKPKMVR